MSNNKSLSDDRTDNNNRRNNPSQGATQATRLFHLLSDRDAKYFVDNQNEPYIEIEIDGTRKVYRVNDSKFKSYLKTLFYDTFEGIPNNTTINDTMGFVSARADMSNDESREFFNRVASVGQNAYEYQIEEGKAVQISETGWKIINNTSNFRTYTHQKSQILPLEDASVDDVHVLFEYINVSCPDIQLLIIAWLVTCLVPKIPHPIIQIYGDKGSSKSTMSEFLKDLIDPSEVNSIGAPKDLKEFIQQISHHWLMVIDNISDIHSSLSDLICRTSTGGAYSKRKLYTDDEDVIFKLQRCLIINSINLVGMRPDLLDRSILIELEPIEPSKIETIAKLQKNFRIAKGRILGALFHILSRAISVHHKINLESMPRMADFAEWGCAVAIVLGHTPDEFMRAYKNNIIKTYTETLENSPIARVVIEFMKDKENWSGTATELIEHLILCAGNMRVDTLVNTFPSSNRTLWTKLKEVRSTLLDAGIKVSKDDSGRGSGRGRLIIIQKTEERQENEEETKSDSSGSTDNSKYPKDISADIDKFLDEKYKDKPLPDRFDF